MCRRQPGEARQQQPLNEALAGADDQFHRLSGARHAKFIQRAQGVANNFVQALSGICKFDRAVTALEQFDTEVFFQFLKLAAELALTV